MPLVADLVSVPDLLRLLTLPAFGWAAYRDLETRRVPNRLWLPIAAVGVLALVIDAQTVLNQSAPFRRIFFRSVALSIGLLVPAAYLLWRVGGFGGADAKALMVIAVVFPTYPILYGPGFTLPHVRAAAGLFSITVLTNAVLVGAAYPLALGVRNALAGRLGWRAFVGLPIAVEDIVERHGRLLESREGFTRSGLDLDALRMYLRWRGVSLATLRSAESMWNPTTLPEDPYDPTDGAVGSPPDRPTDREGLGIEPPGPPETDDPWGAARFLADVDGAYGTTPDQLREGLDLLVERETVWISPGIPFLVPVFLGLLLAVTYGDLLVGILVALGF